MHHKLAHSHATSRQGFDLRSRQGFDLRSCYTGLSDAGSTHHICHSCWWQRLLINDLSHDVLMVAVDVAGGDVDVVVYETTKRKECH